MLKVNSEFNITFDRDVVKTITSKEINISLSRLQVSELLNLLQKELDTKQHTTNIRGVINSQ
jgi:hypothetical protein